MGKQLTIGLILVFALLFTSCGTEEIDACIGAASDPVTADIDCEECCQNNGYQKGLVQTTSSGGNTTRTCKCK